MFIKTDIVEKLLDSAYQDTQLLVGNDKKGDNFSLSRDIEFVPYAQDEKKADTVTSFINNNRYSEAFFRKVENQYRKLW